MLVYFFDSEDLDDNVIVKNEEELMSWIDDLYYDLKDPRELQTIPVQIYCAYETDDPESLITSLIEEDGEFKEYKKIKYDSICKLNDKIEDLFYYNDNNLDH